MFSYIYSEQILLESRPYESYPEYTCKQPTPGLFSKERIILHFDEWAFCIKPILYEDHFLYSIYILQFMAYGA